MVRRIGAIALLVLTTSGAASAQTISGSVRTRVESWDWFETPAADGSYTYLGALLRAAVADQKSLFSWRAEVSVPVLLGLPEDAVAPAPAGQLGMGASYWQASDSAENAASIFLKQAFVRIGRPIAQGGHSLRLGRFEFVDGTELAAKNPVIATLKRDRIAHRLIGNFGWTHVQRSLDGLQYGYDRPGLNVTALASRPTRGVFDVAGMEDLDVVLGYAAVTGALSKDAADWRLFGSHYIDDRSDPRPLKTDNRPSAVRSADAGNVEISTLGGHYLRVVPTSAGTWDVLLWAAYQTGSWGALDHNAHAFAVEGGWQPAALKVIKPWLRAGYFQSSGDDDAADDEHATFFQILPTPRIYARFPFYNLMNMRDAFASLQIRPSPKLTVRSDVHHLSLTESGDLWYAGGGAFEPQTFGYAGRPANLQSSLATTVDISADFRMSDHVSVNGYIAWARGGDVVRRIYAGRDASLAYIELELRK